MNREQAIKALRHIVSKETALRDLKRVGRSVHTSFSLLIAMLVTIGPYNVNAADEKRCNHTNDCNSDNLQSQQKCNNRFDGPYGNHIGYYCNWNTNNQDPGHPYCEDGGQCDYDPDTGCCSLPPTTDAATKLTSATPIRDEQHPRQPYK